MDDDDCWIAISHPARFKRARLIAVAYERDQVELQALERGFTPGQYSVSRVLIRHAASRRAQMAQAVRAHKMFHPDESG